MPRFDTVVEAAKYMAPTDTLSFVIIFLFFAFLVAVFVGGSFLSKMMHHKHLKEHFFRLAEERGLAQDQAELLWQMSREKESDAVLMLEYKAPFEKAVDFYVQQHDDADEKFIAKMRKKLGYDKMPTFVPLMHSKDIELYQGGKVKLGPGRIADVILHDKDERYMYWLLHDVENPRGIAASSLVRITFLRDGDAIYNFEAPVLEVLEDRGRAVVKLAHTRELNRNQRRELSRVECSCPAALSLKVPDETQEPAAWIEGLFADISASGAKWHPQLLQSADALQVDQQVTVRIQLEEEILLVRAKIASIKRAEQGKYYGLQFMDLPDEQKDTIYNYVLNQQKKFAQLLHFQKEI